MRTGVRQQNDTLFVKEILPVSGLKRMNRGARGDSLLMLSPQGLSNKKPPLLSLGESGGSMSHDRKG